MSFASTVQIQPGATLVFTRGASLTAGDALIAQGTVEQPIVLKSEVPSDGYWNGLQLNGARNQIAYLSIEDAGQADGQAIMLKKPFTGRASEYTASLEHLTVAGSLGHGMEVGSDYLIETFADNTFIGNGGHGLIFPFSQSNRLDAGSMYDSALAPNGMKGIRLIAGRTGTGSLRPISLGRSANAVINDVGAPFRLNSLSVADSSSLVIQPGVHLIMDETAAIAVARESELTVNGEADNPVVFKSASGKAGSWTGVTVSQSAMTASHLTISDAGGPNDSRFFRSEKPALGITNSSSTVTLSDVTIRNSDGWAIDCANTNSGNFTFSNLEFSGNALGNVSQRCGQ